MSLKVWLPLNGDLHNQGCSNVTVTNNGATVNTNGKIGSCYHFGTDSQYMTISKEAMNTFTTECSIAFWLKIKSWNTSYATYFQAGLGSNPWTHYIFGFLRNNANSTVCFTISNGSSASNASYLTSSLSLDTWYHVVLTYTTGKCTIYLNGTLDHEYTTSIVPNFAGITTITLGKCNNGSSYQTDCDINDFRIYNHCLSAAEVREISQGLVLHYKLDGFMGGTNSNLAQGSKLLTIASSLTNCNISKRGSPTIETRTDDFAQVKGTAAWQGFSLWSNSLNLKVDTTYTYSFYGYTELSTSTNAGISFYPMMYNSAGTRDTSSTLPISVMGGTFTNSNAKQIGKLNTAPQLYWATFTWNQTMADIIANGGKIELSIQIHGTFDTGRTDYLWAPKLELGDKPTTWTPSIEEMGIDPTKIKDSSGYGNNGSINGNITLSEDTPRYSSSIYVNGSSYILTPTRSFAWNDLTQLTFSAWMKPTASMTGWRGSVGIAADTNYTARGIAITDYGNEFRGTYTNGSGYQTVATGKTLTQNEWHHCAGTLNGTEFKLYFDGELVKTQTIDWGTATLNANARFEVGVDLPGTDEKFTGNYSDVRCYCTVLDADAIRQLYETGAKVDNNQNLHTFELIETNRQEITKQGQTKGQNLLETYLPLYDKNIYTEPDGSTWIHIFHHNNPTASKFNETTLDWTTGKYLDTDRWYDVDQAIYYTLGPYEFMVKQKTTSDATEVKYRWIQTPNPLTAKYVDVKPGTVTFNTSSGYTNSTFGGMYLFKNSQLHMSIANSNSSNWYGGIGAAAAYSGGIPGFPNTTVTTGYIDLYLRVYTGTKIIKNIGINSSKFIEL